MSVPSPMTDSATVSRAFAFVERRYSGTPCQECKGRKTLGLICQGVVIASCEDCGGATRIGPLAKLWDPQAEKDRKRPILRAPQEAAAPGRAARQQPR